VTGARRLLLLGTVRARGDAGEVELRGTQPALLLTKLVTAHGRRVGRAELADAIWPRGPGEHWEGALRGLVGKVRAFLRDASGDGLRITTSGQGYRFEADDGWDVDLWLAEALTSAGADALAQGRTEEAAIDAEGAAALLRSPLLPAVDAPWLPPWRTRLDRCRGSALRTASCARSALGAHAEAVAHAEAAVVLDPVDEASHRVLIEVRRAAGDSAGALRAYGECRRVLQEELGVAPQPETEALYLELLAGDGDDGSSAGSGLGALGVFVPSAFDRPFVGRADELAAIASAWDRVCAASAPEIVVLVGESGAGKTRLALEAGAFVGAPARRYGRCSAERVVPFEPFAEAFAIDVGADAGASAGGADEPHRAGARDEVLGAAARLIREAMPGPTVLVIDDAQWADAGTIALLRRVVRGPIDRPLLVLMTVRDGEPDPGIGVALDELDELDDEVRSSTVRVDGLCIDEVRELLADAGVPDPDAAAAPVRDRTGGNAFYVTQMLDLATEGNGQFDAQRVPATVTELVRLRLAGLDPQSGDALALAAVLGTEVPRDVLSATLGRAGSNAADGVGVPELVRRGFLVEHTDGGFGFAHAIVRDAVYEQMTPLRRRRLHLRVADALEVIADRTAAAALAHHLLAADDPERAARTLDVSIVAIDEALASYAFEHAEGLAERALALADRRLPDDPRVALLSLHLGSARRRAGDFDGARRALDRARKLSDDDPALHAEATLELVARGWRGAMVELDDGARADLLCEAAQRMRACATDTDRDAPLLVSLLVHEASARAASGDRARSLDVAGRAIEIAQRHGDRSVLAGVVEAHRLRVPGPAGASDRLAFTDDLVVAGSGVSPEQVMRLHAWRVGDALELGDRARFDAELDALTRGARATDRPNWPWVVETWRAFLAFMEGDTERADGVALAAIEGAAGVDHLSRMLAYGVQLFGFRLQQGRGAELVGDLRFAIEHSPDTVAMQCALALALAQAGDGDEARELLATLAADDFGAIDPQHWSTSVACLAEACATLGAAEPAAGLLALIEPVRSHFVVIAAPGTGGACWGPYAALLGSLRSCLGDRRGARDEFDHAIDLLDRFGAPMQLALVRATRDRRLAEPCGG
jgi:DNA-binding SARP family transcriptional activator